MHKNDTFQNQNTNCSSFDALANSTSDKSYSGTTVYTSGGLPYNDSFQWARHSGDKPRVVDFELEPISNLFHDIWFQSRPELKRHEFNVTLLKDYFDKYILDGYCKLMLGDECPASGVFKSSLGPQIKSLAFLPKCSAIMDAKMARNIALKILLQ